MLVRIVSVFMHIVAEIRTDRFGVALENKDLRSEKEGFRGLWRRLRPADKPEEVKSHLFTLGAFIYNFNTGGTV